MVLEKGRKTVVVCYTVYFVVEADGIRQMRYIQGRQHDVETWSVLRGFTYLLFLL